ncbi:ISWI chromatin-remodeling complex ATPase Isw1p [Monosporozyma servazzii]
MTADESYWQQLKPFQYDLLTPDLESRQQRYLIQHNKNNDSSKKLQEFNNTRQRFKQLLSMSGLFRHFIETKATKDDKFKSILNELDGKDSDSKKKVSKRKSEKEEDAELLKDEENDGDDDENMEFQFRDSPVFINGKLRSYQVQGLNWLIQLHSNKLAGILADEMGLGKTLQTISFLGYLRYIKKISGPFLVIAPKSTLNNWQREINKWTPDVNAFVLQGDKEERAKMIKDKLLSCDFDIVIASYEIIIREKTYFKRFDWEYIVIDEAHRIKNEESLLSQVLREFTSRNRLLITGTPLQNNLHELWALLNFLLPDIFSSSQDFDEWFSSDTSEEEKENIVKQLRTILQPFLLRRMKNEVETSLLPKKEINLYVGMSSMQRKWYKQILEKDIDAVNGTNGNKDSKTRLLNIVMQLRKCCNHPYLFDGAEPGPPYTTDEHLIFNSAKLKVLDKLLKKVKEEGSRVLIFSQMSRVLDIMEDYCFFRDYKYCRIDGSTDHEDRIRSIDEYNAPDSDKFIFLLTTRAGGLGINLTSADIVVLYDSDWNPQADLQAMDRAHRIGQKKQVKVFRFVTENSVEDKILERATQKLKLDQLVIQKNSGMGKKKEGKGESKDSLLSMIQHGVADVFQSKDNSASSSKDGTPNAGDKSNGKLNEKANETNKDPDPEVDLDQLLSASEDKTKSLNAKYESLGLDDLQKFNQESAYEWNGTDFKKQQVKKDIIDPNWLHSMSSRRERTQNYSYDVDTYYKDVLNPKKAPTPLQPRMPKPRQFNSHQLMNVGLKDLYEKERLWIAKKTAYTPNFDDVKATDGDDLSETELNEKLEKLKEAISKAEALTSEEEKMKIQWESEGFGKWNKIEFRKFISLSGKYGRNSIQAIASELAPGKNLEEVEAYAKAFWANYQLVDDHEKLIKSIEVEEDKLRKIQYQKDILRLKISDYKNPFFDLKLNHPPSSNNKRIFSKEEDRFILITLNKYGLDREDINELIRDEIRDCPLFELNFFFQSRTLLEIGRRVYTLMQCLEKEFELKNGQILRVVEEPKKTTTNHTSSIVSKSGTVTPGAKKIKTEKQTDKPNGSNSPIADKVNPEAENDKDSKSSSPVKRPVEETSEDSAKDNSESVIDPLSEEHQSKKVKTE